MLAFLRPWIFIQLLFLSFVSYASVGKLVLSTGTVEVERGNQLVSLALGGEVFAEDHIFTRAKSSAQLKFSDDTVITLGANTDLKVEEVLFDGANSQASFAVGRGGFKTITGKIGKLNPERFKLNTPTSTIGIRGTIFSGKIEVDKETFATLRGRISITDRETQDLIDLPAGMMVEIITGSGPQPIQEITPEALEEIAQSDDDSASDEADSTEGLGDFVGVSESSDDPAAAAPHDLVDTHTLVQESRDLDRLDEIEGSVDITRSFSGWEKVVEESNGSIISIDLSPFNKTIRISEAGEYFDDWKDTDYVGWGKWESSSNPAEHTYLIAGLDSDKAADFISSKPFTTTPNYTYSGHMLGEYIPLSNDPIALDETNTSFELTFHFSDGYIGGEFTFPDNYQATVADANFDGSKFESFGPSNDGLSIEGRFFGDEAQAIGGTFELGVSGIEAAGVFKGSR